jgi:hypothetical protein
LRYWRIWQWEYAVEPLLRGLSTAHRILKQKAQGLFDNCSDYDGYGGEKNRRVEKYTRNLMLAQSVELYNAFTTKWNLRPSASVTCDGMWDGAIEELFDKLG